MPLRLRTLLLWGIFLLAAVAAGLAVHRLRQAAQREIAEQATRTVRQALDQALGRIDQQAAGARLALITELAGFHEDGLATSLQRWDTANELVVETFVWDATRGFSAIPEKPVVAREQLPPLWRTFREWRAAHPSALVREPAVVAGFNVWALRTLDNPALPAATLRYQAENLDLAGEGGRKVDPWAGWAGDPANPGAAWILWYQAGPDAPVRGCVVDPAPLVGKWRAAIDGGELVNVALVPQPNASAGNVLPGYRLTASAGRIFEEKVADVSLTAWGVVLMLGLFLLGAAALGFHTWREARDAGRKITFVTQVSHELRTPLTSIRMFADMLVDTELPPEKRRRFAENISTESARLGGLIERLLAFNALGQGRKVVTPVPIDVGPIVRQVVEETAGQLAAAGLRAESRLPAAPVRALGDASSLKQALLNLVDNAGKYAREGGAVEISLEAAADRVFVRVADRGPGIPAGVRARLFEPFVQGGEKLTNKSPGVGLGLSLARGLLRQAGGDLVLVSAPRGTTFEIRLPAANSP